MLGQTAARIADGADPTLRDAQITEAAVSGNSIGTLGIRFANAQIDPAWDALVEATPGGDLVQTTLWAATRQRIGMRVSHLRLCTPDGAPAAGCLIQYRRLLPKLWIGVVPRGPLVFVNQAGLASRLIREMIRAAREVGIFLLVVQPPEGTDDRLHAAMDAAGFRLGGPSLAPNATIRIDLRRSEEEILRSAHRRRRTHIRNVMRNSFECRSSDDIQTFHRLHVVSANRLGFPPIWIGNLEAQWETLSPKGMCHLLEVRYNGTPIGGEWLTCFGGIVTNKLRGQDLSRIPVSPASKVAGTALLWSSICWARMTGARYFDFGGFDRAAAEAVLSGRPLPAKVHSPSEIKWSFGGEVVLMPQSKFVFTNRLGQRALGALVSPLLNSNAVRWLGQRIRTRRGKRGSGAGFLAMRVKRTMLRPLVRPRGEPIDALARKLLGPAYCLMRDLREELADRRLGITTRNELVLREVGLSNAIEEHERRPHRAVPYSVAQRAMRNIGPTPADRLLDLGCGSGRLICLAAQFAFSRIVGVELNPGFAKIATRNASALRRGVVHPEVVRADAAVFPVPDDITVVWMFNPFEGEVFRAALARITESFDRRPRRLRLVYYNPKEHDVVTSTGRFRQTEALRVWWWPSANNGRFRMINVYEVVAP